MTSTEIANLALGHLGVGKEIQDLESEKSAEAMACRRFFDACVDETLRSFPWPFATKFAVLSLVAELETTDAGGDEWAYSYRYPSDCLLFRRILSGKRQDTRDTRVPYKEAQDEQGLLIYTDEVDAECEYTVRATNYLRWPIDARMALSYLLASRIAPRLTAGDPYKMTENNLKLFSLAIKNARANALNEEQPDQNPDAEIIRARE